MVFLGAGLALRRLAKAASNFSFSTFIFPSWYYGGCGGIRTPETCGKHVYADYKPGPLDLSGTHPRAGSKPDTVASQHRTDERRTTTHAESLARESQRASLFLTS